MINPISFTQSEGFETQKNSLFDAAEAESNGENFATFFNLSIFAPPTPPIKVAKTENQGETADNVQLENVKQNSQSTLPVNSTDAVLTVETKPAPSTTVTTNPNETVKNNFPLQMLNTRREITNTDIIESLRRKFAAPLNGKNLVNVSESQMQTLFIKRENFDMARQNFSSVNPAISDNTATFVKLENPMQTQINQVMQPLEGQKISETIKTDASVENQQNISFQIKPQETITNQVSSAAFQGIISSSQTDLSITENNPVDVEISLETKPAPPTTVTANPNETVKNNFPIQMMNTRREITNTDIISSLRRKFAAPLNGKNLVNVSENQIQPQPQTTVRAQTPTITATETQNQILTPNITNENIETVQENFSKQTNQVVELINDQNSAEAVKVNVSNNSGQNLAQSERETPKISVEFENSADSSEQILDKFVNAVAKEQQIIEGNRQAQDLSAKVVEQIEPRIIEIANLNRNGNEKKVLKLKLNPEELGSVEITLERTADGRMNAYFQTESEQTRQILNENLAQLRNSLENSGLQIGNLDISNNSFSSGGNENREAFRQQFGTNENQPAATQNFDGNSNKQDDEQSRLVNLRA